jgi:pyruvate-formate lyase-activating enzyme
MTNPENTICRLRWDYPIVNFDRNDSRLCCRTPGQTISSDEMIKHGTDAFLNNDFQLQRRLEMLKGIKHADCKSCWKLEDNNMASPRLGSHDFMKTMQKRGLIPDEYKDNFHKFAESVTIDSPILKSYSPDMFEISLGNLCDMKCMYCSHHYSTQWAAELIKHNEISKENYEKEFPQDKSYEDLFWKWFNETGKHSLKRIGIIGGEPLIMPKFYEFMDNLLEAYKELPEKKKKVTIWIVTNMNNPKLYFDKFINSIPKITEFFNLEVHASMESMGKQAEYIRNGVNWDRFESNVRTLLKGKHDIAFGFQMAISALNIPQFKDYLIWVKSLHDEYNHPIALKQNIISYPDWQSPLILTQDFAHYLYDTIDWLNTVKDDMMLVDDEYGKWTRYPNYLDGIAKGIMTTQPDYDKRKKFYNWFTKYDSRRNLNFLETFPLHAEFWEHCKSL